MNNLKYRENQYKFKYKFKKIILKNTYKNKYQLKKLEKKRLTIFRHGALLNHFENGHVRTPTMASSCV